MKYPAGPAAFCCVLLLVATIVHSATPRQVEDAIKRGQDYLFSVQKDGNWEAVPARLPHGKDANGKDVPHINSSQWGGTTAIVTYALLASGISPQDARLAGPIAFLKKTDLIGIYALGMRAQVWPFLPKSPEIKSLIQKDAKLLEDAMKPKPPSRGLFDYTKGNGTRVDHSVSQYGVLGLWACERAGAEVKVNAWKLIEEAWEETQSKDGGWCYALRESLPHDDTHNGQYVSTASMTAAGVASLFITQDYRHADAGLNCSGNIYAKNIDRGIEWLSAHIEDIFKGRDWYTYYGIERIGVASGRKYFGTIDWFSEGADTVFKFQNTADGSWKDRFGPAVGTSFCLLFLSRGRAPVVMNKLQYEITDAKSPGNRILGNWNQRPRDVANLTRYVAENTERALNWQIVNLKVSPEELLDSPILFISGNQALSFTDEEEKKLQSYIQQGGLILGHADCANKEFAESFKALGKKWFAPKYEFRELEQSHPIYRLQQFKPDKWKNKPSLYGLGNEVRELMLLLPSSDSGKAWQMQEDKGREEQYQIGADIVLYTVDKSNLRNKGDSDIVTMDASIKPAQTIEVARVIYPGGDPDPEPGGWNRLKAIFNNQYRTDLSYKPAVLGKRELANFKIAHMTGTLAFKLDTGRQDELKRFVDDGGTLIIDCAGNSSGTFGESVESLLEKMYPKEFVAAKNKLPKDHPAFNVSGMKIETFEYRPFYKLNHPATSNPQIRGLEINGRTAIFYSAEDLSFGLVGARFDGVSGYTPETATNIMSNLLFFASGQKPQSPPPPPAPKPAKKK